MSNWNTVAVEVLVNLYVETNIPSDPLIKDYSVLCGFTATLNSRLDSQENFTTEEVASKLMSIRKAGRLPRLRR